MCFEKMIDEVSPELRFVDFPLRYASRLRSKFSIRVNKDCGAGMVYAYGLAGKVCIEQESNKPTVGHRHISIYSHPGLSHQTSQRKGRNMLLPARLAPCFARKHECSGP